MRVAAQGTHRGVRPEHIGPQDYAIPHGNGHVALNNDAESVLSLFHKDLLVS
ncbi:MAG: hypothetical protein QGI86_16090 [Candidatus Poribacteria bacterium]|nr:hypothetical protein [Candidatus Poribacteria bacterium]MDP6748519.1 hypothetical protein [Candidatus Poribacteria bacterium]MDP6998606.1 hypothetical protein [Candidatus Poribacteria bacterium]